MIRKLFSAKSPESRSGWSSETLEQCCSNSILETANSHLGSPIIHPCFWQRRKTSWRLSTWEDRSRLKMRMLSTYTKQKGRSLRTWSIRRWKVLPAFLKPKGMHKNLYIPKGVMMAVFWSHRDLIITLLTVEFGENCQSSNSWGKIGDIQKKVAIRYSNGV